MNAMNHTSRMTQLLGAFRRERNGLVADTMHYEGARYGLNYGVSLPTVRQLVRGVERDHDFARFLYGQDVRCLQLAALHLADPERLAEETEFAFWLNGVRNSELAEEAAFALFSRCEQLSNRLTERLTTDEPLHLYLLLMAAARRTQGEEAWIEASLQAVRRMALSNGDLHLPLRGLITLWAHLAEDEAVHKKVAEAVAALGSTPWEELLREELSWRLGDQ